MNIKNFYPTPLHLIQKMLNGIEIQNLSILEPSAGKGDIADYIRKRNKQYYSKQNVDIDCIEIVPELQSILRGKNHRVIYDDFLTFNTYKRYDYIIMNPPFDQGDKHLLKAIELQKHGGKIICLLNAETLNNLYSNTRKELDRKLLELNADIQYLDGQFETEDTFRQTSVKIALIKINIPESQQESDILNNLKQAIYYTQDDEKIKNDLISGDFLEGLIQQYNFEMQAGIKLINEYLATKDRFLRSFDTRLHGSILSLVINDRDTSSNEANLINNFANMVRDKYWRALFESKEFVSISTSQLREQYYSKLNTMKDYEFNMFNIEQIKHELKIHLYKSVEDTIMSLFDELSYQSSYDNEFSKNIHYYNGWKTNKSWYINKKVILRLNAFQDIKYGFHNPRFDWRFKSKLDDIEKVFNYLDNCMTQEIKLDDALKQAERVGQSKGIKTKFFEIDVFKKGTTHLTFTNLELLKKFNLFGSMRKGWLPPSFAKKNYHEMDKEEKNAVDDFCGKDDYEEIIAKQDYYIYNPKDIKLLA